MSILVIHIIKNYFKKLKIKKDKKKRKQITINKLIYKLKKKVKIKIIKTLNNLL